MSNIGIISVIYDRLVQVFNFTNEIQPKKNVVVVGYGWGGRAFCNNIDTKKYNVTVVSKTPYMLNTPKLKNSIDNQEDNLIIFNKNTKINFIEGECNDIDKQHNIIKTNKDTIKFDYLIVAVGSEVNDFGVSGVKENCYFLKSLEDLNDLKKSLETNKYKNNNSPYYGSEDLKIVVLGGGPTGIELAFELSKKHKDITIVEGMKTILPIFNEESVKKVQEDLQKHSIKLILDNVVKKIEPSEIKTNNNSIPYDLAIWTCGIKPNPFIRKLTTERFVVDKHLKFSNNIFAIGDIVASKELGPPTGQNAKNQGKYLANYFNNNFQGDEYKYEELGKLLHSKENIILETKYGVFRLPNFTNVLFDYIIEN
jgi:NADH:ubiquinone reductase (non-electrogenic)